MHEQAKLAPPTPNLTSRQRRRGCLGRSGEWRRRVASRVTHVKTPTKYAPHWCESPQARGGASRLPGKTRETGCSGEEFATQLSTLGQATAALENPRPRSATTVGSLPHRPLAPAQPRALSPRRVPSEPGTRDSSRATITYAEESSSPVTGWRKIPSLPTPAPPEPQPCLLPLDVSIRLPHAPPLSGPSPSANRTLGSPVVFDPFPQSIAISALGITFGGQRPWLSRTIRGSAPHLGRLTALVCGQPSQTPSVLQAESRLLAAHSTHWCRDSFPRYPFLPRVRAGRGRGTQ